MSKVHAKLQVTNHSLRQDDIDPDNMTYEVMMVTAEFYIPSLFLADNKLWHLFDHLLVVVHRWIIAL